jgi:bla regulator protein BlaR1
MKKRPWNTLVRLCLVAITLLCISHAQAQLAHKGPAAAIALSETLPSYDVSSIRQNDSNVQSWGMGLHDNVLFTATNVPLKSIIAFAYDVKEDLVSGLSGPVSSVSFDITAKVLPGDDGSTPKLTDAQLQAMIIPLLADRFHLKTHLEPKVLPVYDLVVAHGGCKLKLDSAEQNGSGWSIDGSDTMKVLSGKSDSIADLADMLSGLSGRKVIDKTGLTGHADITLKWSDDVAMQQGGSDALSIFTAVEEQLGLKLEPSKGPVDTLVIDHAEMPSSN